MKKVLSVILSLLLLLSLTACGAKSEAADTMAYPETPMAEPQYDFKGDYDNGFYAGAVEESLDMEMSWDEPQEEAPVTEESASEPGTGSTSFAEKIIYSASLSMESTEFDKTIATIDSLIAQYGGYIQSSNVNGDTRYNDDGTTTVVNRNAWYTISIPTEHFETFLTESGNAGNVTSTYRTAENITSAYTDTEARLNSLRIQEERLVAMMEETGDLESLITLEARLSEVTYEIEAYQRQLSNWDRRVAYSTIDIELREVNVYTPTVPVTRTFGEKLADAFSDGWRGFTRGLQNFILWFAEALPALILWAAIITGIVVLVKKLSKRARKIKLAKKVGPTPEEKAEKKQDDFPR